MRLERLQDMVVELRVLGVGNVVDAEELLRLAHTLLGQRNGACLDVGHVVAALRLFLAHEKLRF